MLGEQAVIAEGVIRKMTLLGHGAPLEWKRDAVAMEVELPAGIDQKQPAYALKIEPIDHKLCME